MFACGLLYSLLAKSTIHFRFLYLIPFQIFLNPGRISLVLKINVVVLNQKDINPLYLKKILLVTLLLLVTHLVVLHL